MVVVLHDLSVGGLLADVEVLVVALAAGMMMSPWACLLLSRVWDIPIPRVDIVSKFRVNVR
jgi:hypothetical protein